MFLNFKLRQIKIQIRISILKPLTAFFNLGSSRRDLALMLYSTSPSGPLAYCKATWRARLNTDCSAPGPKVTYYIGLRCDARIWISSKLPGDADADSL